MRMFAHQLPPHPIDDIGPHIFSVGESSSGITTKTKWRCAYASFEPIQRVAISQ
jgi:hypothetical protein